MACTHPNQLRGADGALRCLTCGARIDKPAEAQAPPEGETKKPAPRRKSTKKAD